MGTNIPQCEPIPVPGTKEWAEWQAEQIRIRVTKQDPVIISTIRNIFGAVPPPIFDESSREVKIDLLEKGEREVEYWEGASFIDENISQALNRWIDNTCPHLRGQNKQYGSISLTQKEYSKVIKRAKRKMKEELKQLRKKNEEENIKSDFYMTHEIGKISGEIEGILMIYEALEEVE